MSREIIRAVAGLVTKEVFSNDEYRSFRRGFEVLDVKNDYDTIFNVSVSFKSERGGKAPNFAAFDVRVDGICREDIVIFRYKDFKSKKIKNERRDRFRYTGYNEANEFKHELMRKEAVNGRG